MAIDKIFIVERALSGRSYSCSSLDRIKIVPPIPAPQWSVEITQVYDRRRNAELPRLQIASASTQLTVEREKEKERARLHRNVDSMSYGRRQNHSLVSEAQLVYVK